MGFATELHSIYKNKKAELNENRDAILARREKDVTLFFEKEVKEGAMEKMKTRAEAGRPTANLLEYQYNERFYIDETQSIRRYINEDVNFPNYRIHDVVMRDKGFNELLMAFEREISSGDDSQIHFSRWKPRETTHVIEAVWGRNKYHQNNRTFRNHSTRPFVTRESEYIPIKRVGTARRYPSSGSP